MTESHMLVDDPYAERDSDEMWETFRRWVEMDIVHSRMKPTYMRVMRVPEQRPDGGMT